MVWTLDDVADQSGRSVLITGATSGIGLEAARVLAKRHAHLILACRNAEKMAAVAEELRTEGASQVDELVCDLSNLDSVRTCATAYATLGHPIDVLLLNAGLGEHSAPTAQGYEKIVATNHLAHFLLTGLLLPHVRGRIVVVSSISHKHTYAPTIDWDAIAGKKPPGGEDLRYAESKLANLLFVEELNRRLMAAGSDIIAVGAHPGFSASDFPTAYEPSIRKSVSLFLMRNVAQSTAHGAWPVLMAVTDENATRGAYYGPSKGWFFSETHGPPMSTAVKSKLVTDIELAKECWSKSEALTSFSFSIR